jgi:hypothetical protein
MMLIRMIIYVKLQYKRKKRNDLTNLLVGIDVCIEEVVVVCGTEAYIGEAERKIKLK